MRPKHEAAVVAQGSNDPIVAPSESKQLMNAVRPRDVRRGTYWSKTVTRILHQASERLRGMGPPGMPTSRR